MDDDYKRFCLKCSWNDADMGCTSPRGEEIWQCPLYIHYHPEEIKEFEQSMEEWAKQKAESEECLIENILEKTICRDCEDCLLHSLIPQERFCFKYGVACEDTEEAIEEWLSSFDTASATECFTAVNLLKERLGKDE